MSLSQETVHKRKEEIRKIHHVIDVYYKRGWVEQEKYEKYLRILDKIKVDDDEYHDKMQKFRKKVEHIKKSNTQHRSSKSIPVDDAKVKEQTKTKVKFEIMEESKNIDAKKVLSFNENTTQSKADKRNQNSKAVIRMDDNETIEVCLDTSKPKDMKQKPTETNIENERGEPNVLVKNKKHNRSAKETKDTSTTHITDSIENDFKLDRNETERVFVEMCVFARLGFLQPPSCVRCVYNSVLKGNLSENDVDQVPCERIIAWRKDANKKIDSENMKGTLTFVKCHDAKKWANGHAADNMRWDQVMKKLQNVQ